MTVAIVVRKSTRDEQHVSNLRQEKIGREWAAAARPGVPVEVFADNATPGTDMQRDGWTRFTHAVRMGRITDVWCYEQSRLTRAGLATWDEVIVMLSVAKLLEVHTHRQGTISVRAGNRLNGRLLAVIDQEEREVVQVRVIDTMDVLAAEGRPSGGRVYGYTKGLDDAGRKTRVVVDAEAEVIREAARRIIAGEPMMQIADDLVARGVPTARGGSWRMQTVRSIVSNTTVAALRVHQGQFVPGTWPAILERDQWEQVRARLADTRTVIDRTGRPRRIVHPLRNGRRYLLTGGVARCGRCGAAMAAQTRTVYNSPNRQPAYTCPTSRRDGACGGVSMKSEWLEAWVVATLFRLAAAGGLASRVSDDGERIRLTAELQEAEGRQRTLAEDFGAGLLPEDAYREGLAVAAERTARIRSNLGALAPADVPELDEPHLLEERWPDLTLARKRAVLAAAFAWVKVAPSNRQHHKFDPNRITFPPESPAGKRPVPTARRHGAHAAARHP